MMSLSFGFFFFFVPPTVRRKTGTWKYLTDLISSICIINCRRTACKYCYHHNVPAEQKGSINMSKVAVGCDLSRVIKKTTTTKDSVTNFDCDAVGDSDT